MKKGWWTVPSFDWCICAVHSFYRIQITSVYYVKIGLFLYFIFHTTCQMVNVTDRNPSKPPDRPDVFSRDHVTVYCVYIIIYYIIKASRQDDESRVPLFLFFDYFYSRFDSFQDQNIRIDIKRGVRMYIIYSAYICYGCRQIPTAIMYYSIDLSCSLTNRCCCYSTQKYLKSTDWYRTTTNDDIYFIAFQRFP